MIFEEEDIAKIVKRNKLAEIGNSMVPAIKFCIEKIQNTKRALSWKELAKEKLTDYMGDFWELKDEIVSPMDGKSFTAKERETINKITSIWNNAYSELIKLESAIDDYNKKFPNNKLEHLEELTGKKPTPSVKTDYFGY